MMIFRTVYFGRLSVLALALLAILTSSCDHSVFSNGSPCGGNQHAFASVLLPDTGINAGRTIQVDFIQHVLSGELSELVIQQAWPMGTAPDPEPDPRVRLVSTSGRVFVDTLGTRYDQLSGRFDRPTWDVLHWIRDARTRNELYDAFATQSLWLELWHSNSAAPGTRVLLKTGEFGVYPRAHCV